MVLLDKPANEVEAQAVVDLLRSEGVPHVVRPYELAVLPGVTLRGQWGEIRVPPGELDRAKQLLQAFREAGVDEEELERQARSVSFRYRPDE